ncbi:hypothetical protein Hanom_Chr07g00589941 [Helianthus anomalus]
MPHVHEAQYKVKSAMPHVREAQYKVRVGPNRARVKMDSPAQNNTNLDSKHFKNHNLSCIVM